MAVGAERRQDGRFHEPVRNEQQQPEIQLVDVVARGSHGDRDRSPNVVLDESVVQTIRVRQS